VQATEKINIYLLLDHCPRKWYACNYPATKLVIAVSIYTCGKNYTGMIVIKYLERLKKGFYRKKEL
jgi:hypothetical protein